MKKIFLIFTIFFIIGSGCKNVQKKLKKEEITKVVVFLPNQQGKLKKVSLKLKKDNLPKDVLNILSSPPKHLKNFTSSFPVNCKVKDIKIREKTAYVNFNQDCATYGGGSTQEIIFVGSVVLSLTQIKGIDGVKLLFDEKELNYLPQGTEVKQVLKQKDYLHLIK
jgi:spore germination protein GerM